MRFLLAAAAAFFMLSLPAGAAKPRPFALNGVGGQWDRGIEKQTWTLPDGSLDPNHTVTNPTNGACYWDINDHSNTSATTGYITPGTNETIRFCHIFDSNPIYACSHGYCGWWSGASNWVGLNVTASAPTLDVSVCFDTPARCFAPSPTQLSSKVYWWKWCGHPVYTPDDPAIQPIPDSGGGLGVLTHITFSITNNGPGTVKDVTAGGGLSSDIFFPAGCPQPPAVQFGANNPDLPVAYDYPFRWISQS